MEDYIFMDSCQSHPLSDCFVSRTTVWCFESQGKRSDYGVGYGHVPALVMAMDKSRLAIHLLKSRALAEAKTAKQKKLKCYAKRQIPVERNSLPLRHIFAMSNLEQNRQSSIPISSAMQLSSSLPL